jgi:tRNA(Ile)-lysidine synthase
MTQKLSISSFSNNQFLQSVSETITEHRMIGPGDTVLIGFSAGPDSIALTYCLHLLSGRIGFRIVAAHLNHGLRALHADNDAAFAEMLAGKFGVPIIVDFRNVKEFQKAHKLSLEEAAREVRYDFLIGAAKLNGCSKIALGHHADDNAELLLMNLFRGSGITGLTGIPPVRAIQSPEQGGEELFIVRPLIANTKKQIEAFLEAQGFCWRTDESNFDVSHLRNRIRHDLIPMLVKQYNPNIVVTLNRLAKVARGEEEWISNFLTPQLCKLIQREDEGGLCLSAIELRTQPPPVIRRIIRLAIKRVKGELRSIRYQHVEKVMALCCSDGGAGQLDLPDQIRVKRIGDHLWIIRSEIPLRQLPASFPQIANTLPHACYRIERPGTVSIGYFGMKVIAEIFRVESIADFQSAGKNEAYLDLDTVVFPLIIRQIQPGDSFVPLGASGKQKIKKFFIDHKIPRSDRRRCPILISDEKIVWIMGYRIDDRFKVTDATKKILKIELSLAEPTEGD